MKGKLKLAAIILGASLLLSSCGSRLACKNRIDGVRCESLTDVYEDQVINRGQSGVEGPAEKKTNVAETSRDRAESGGASDIIRRLEIESRHPLRLPPRVISIWIAPWEDEDGDLHEEGFVYTEISSKEGRWVLGEKAMDAKNPRLKRLEDIATESEAWEGKVREETPKERKRENMVRPKQEKGVFIK